MRIGNVYIHGLVLASKRCLLSQTDVAMVAIAGDRRTEAWCTMRWPQYGILIWLHAMNRAPLGGSGQPDVLHERADRGHRKSGK